MFFPLSIQLSSPPPHLLEYCQYKESLPLSIPTLFKKLLSWNIFFLQLINNWLRGPGIIFQFWFLDHLYFSWNVCCWSSQNIIYTSRSTDRHILSKLFILFYFFFSFQPHFLNIACKTILLLFTFLVVCLMDDQLALLGDFLYDCVP